MEIENNNDKAGKTIDDKLTKAQSRRCDNGSEIMNGQLNHTNGSIVNSIAAVGREREKDVIT